MHPVALIPAASRGWGGGAGKERHNSIIARGYCVASAEKVSWQHYTLLTNVIFFFPELTWPKLGPNRFPVE